MQLTNEITYYIINCITILKLIWFFKLLNMSVPDGVQKRVLHTKFDIYYFLLKHEFVGSLCDFIVYVGEVRDFFRFKAMLDSS